jgi:regulator of replication initiation timing
MASVAEQLNKVVEKTERLIELCAALQEENDLLKLESEALNVALKASTRKASCIEACKVVFRNK